MLQKLDSSYTNVFFGHFQQILIAGMFSPISYISLRIIHFSKITEILNKFPDFVDFQSPPESVDGGWHWRYTIFEQ